MLDVDSINRDVGEQAKGARLQKLRAVELLLDSLERPGNIQAYCAIEFEGDVYLKETFKDRTEEYHEEDKNYEAKSGFTLASNAVINTLVIFADCWIAKSCREEVVFGFYAPNEHSKERTSDRSKRLQIEWPTRPTLELLKSGELSDPKLIDAVKKLLLDEYRIQYPATNSNKPRGYLHVIESWDEKLWVSFLKQITWKLGQEDHNQLTVSLRNKVRRSKHYTKSISGKEGQIVSLLCDLLDERQSASNPTERNIHSSDLEVIFLRVGAGIQRLPDPSWKTWESIPKPTDSRNLADKVIAVYEQASRAELGRWSRRASNSLITQQEFDDDTSLRSIKYHVFDVCEEKLEELKLQNGTAALDAGTISSWIEVLNNSCEERLKDCQNHYAYSITGKSFLIDMVWELIDSCYLALDVRAS